MYLAGKVFISSQAYVWIKLLFLHQIKEARHADRDDQ